MPRLLVVLASTRPVRAGAPVADWFASRGRAHGGFDVELADLRELALPVLDEPKHPRFGDYEHDHTKAWSATVAAADAFALVMPEYNHSFTAPLKNAIDFLHAEWRRKPVGFVSYGGVAAGTRAVQALKPVTLAVGMMPATPAVHIPFVASRLADGVFTADEPLDQSADAMLDELLELQRLLMAGAGFEPAKD
jgi:NAD(P)H-dependent FMN reductase